MTFSDVSTGAQNDLQRATDIAKRMVMDFGMSRLGRVTFREGQSASMLGESAEYGRAREHSEQTAWEIDQEISRIIDGNLEKVRHILENKRPTLVAIAERLIEIEVVDQAELEEIIEGHEGK
jgi:cell division protease FtsH